MRGIKETTMKSLTSQLTFIPMNIQMSSTAQTENISHSVWPGGKVLTTENTPSSCRLSKFLFIYCTVIWWTLNMHKVSLGWIFLFGITGVVYGLKSCLFFYCVYCPVSLCYTGPMTPHWTTLSMWALPAALALGRWAFSLRSGCLPLCVSTSVRVRSSGEQMALCPWQRPTPEQLFVSLSTSQPSLQACLYQPATSALKFQSVSYKH